MNAILYMLTACIEYRIELLPEEQTGSLDSARSRDASPGETGLAPGDTGGPGPGDTGRTPGDGCESGTVLWSSGFDDGSLGGLDPYCGDWWTQSGELWARGWGGGVDAWAYTEATFDLDCPLQIEARFEFPEGSPSLFVLDSTGHWYSEYRIEVWGDDTVGDYRNRVAIGKYEAGVQSSLSDAISAVPLVAGAVLTVHRDVGNIEVFADGVLVGEGADPNPLPAGGHAGLGSIWADQAAWDWVEVSIP